MGSAEAADWLEPVANDGDWLETVRSGVPYDELRFQVMRGTGRVWACDGEYVAYRPFNHALDLKANPATQSRHANFLASGHYEHVGTFDEVQIFKLLPGSPFRRDNRTFIPGQNLFTDMRQAAAAACARDWVSYHDILDAIASGLKEHLTPGYAKTVFDDCLAQITTHIQQRGGPTQIEVDAGFSNVRAKRGYGGKSQLVLPARR